MKKSNIILAGKPRRIQEGWIKLLKAAGIDAKLFESGDPDDMHALGVEVSAEVAGRWVAAHESTRGLKGQIAIDQRIRLLKGEVAS